MISLGIPGMYSDPITAAALRGAALTRGRVRGTYTTAAVAAAAAAAAFRHPTITNPAATMP